MLSLRFEYREKHTINFVPAEQFVEHGAGGSGDEDSGGGSDSGSEESFDSAELFDNFNLIPESK